GPRLLYGSPRAARLARQTRVAERERDAAVLLGVRRDGAGALLRSGAPRDAGPARVVDRRQLLRIVRRRAAGRRLRQRDHAARLGERAGLAAVSTRHQGSALTRASIRSSTETVQSTSAESIVR